MRNVGNRNNRRRSHLASNASTEIVAGKTELAGMGRQALALLQRVFDRVRCEKCLRAEQTEGQQEVGEVLFHDAKSNSDQSTCTSRPLRYSPSGKAKSTG